MTTYPNGRLPTIALRDITTPGDLLVGAAASFERLRTAAKADGHNMGSSAADQTYRSLATQAAILEQNYDHTPRPGLTYSNGGVKSYAGKTWYRKPGYATASTPGESNHGFGIALDFQGLGGWEGYNGQPEGAGYRWMRQHAGEYGWDNVQGRSIGEPWHWVYTAANDKHRNDKPAPVEDDVKRQNLQTIKKTQKLPNGAWKTLALNDDGDTSLLINGSKAAVKFDVLAGLQVTGLPAGRELQARFIRVKYDAAGKAQTVGVIEPSFLEPIIGTSGTSGGTFAQKGTLPAGQRLRLQVKTFYDDVTVTFARGTTDYF